VALIRSAAKVAASAAEQKRKNELVRRKPPKASGDKAFLSTIAKAREWTDFQLLMRTFKELGAEPLLLTMPIEDIRLEARGLSPTARDAYVQRIEGIAKKYSFPMVSFREHEKQPDFLIDFADHLSAEGWTYYNKTLDDFFHGRLAHQ
jgi:D-alanine transfer protein